MDLGVQNQPIRFLVKNTGATTIERGMVVEWDAVGAIVGEKVGNEAVSGLAIPGIIGTVSTSGADDMVYLGIATEDIKQNETGYVCAFGVVPVEANAAIAAGVVIAPAAAGQVLDAANGTHAQPIGIMLEASAAAGEKKVAMVNFIQPHGRWNGAAAGTATKFMGVAY